MILCLATIGERPETSPPLVSASSATTAALSVVSRVARAQAYPSRQRPVGNQTEMRFTLTESPRWSGLAVSQIGAKMKKFTPEQRNKGMEAWMKWMNENKAFILEGGAPLGKTKRADATGVSDTKNNIGGYSIVQAETHDAAAKLFGRDHPHLQMPGAWVEILEIMPLPGM